MKRILLVEPNFPISSKSRNHKNFLPIGLLKIGGYYKKKRIATKVKLVRGNVKLRFVPDKIFITSLFTYWSEYFWESVKFYREEFPSVVIHIGGIYVSLFYRNSEFRKMARKYRLRSHCGVLKYIENFNKPDYALLNSHSPEIDYQILHTSRGCIRSCRFCGVWKIEPRFEAKKSVKNEIKYKKLVFYDNNLLANPFFENILDELIYLKTKNKIVWCESQSGFDGRQLLKKPHLAKKLKQAGFRCPRIAWDWNYSEFPKIKEQINLLLRAGYVPKDIYVFMIYNWDINFSDMERKRKKCWEWQVQISDCRYRPLSQTFDNYIPVCAGQTLKDYYIHEKSGWSDDSVKLFRRNVRRQNICVRQGLPFYSKDLERKRINNDIVRIVKQIKSNKAKVVFLEKNNISYWLPDDKLCVMKQKKVNIEGLSRNDSLKVSKDLALVAQ